MKFGIFLLQVITFTVAITFSFLMGVKYSEQVRQGANWIFVEPEYKVFKKVKRTVPKPVKKPEEMIQQKMEEEQNIQETEEISTDQKNTDTDTSNNNTSNNKQSIDNDIQEEISTEEKVMTPAEIMEKANTQNMEHATEAEGETKAPEVLQ